MIQKSLSGAVEPEEQEEVDQIDRQSNSNIRSEAIQVPPLHEALVEVHQEYEKDSRAAKDMAELYKRAIVTADVLNAQCAQGQIENQQLKDQLQKAQAVLEKASD